MKRYGPAVRRDIARVWVKIFFPLLALVALGAVVVQSTLFKWATDLVFRIWRAAPLVEAAVVASGRVGVWLCIRPLLKAVAWPVLLFGVVDACRPWVADPPCLRLDDVRKVGAVAAVAVATFLAIYLVILEAPKWLWFGLVVVAVYSVAAVACYFELIA